MKVYDYKAFKERIATEAGTQPHMLSASDEEKYAKKILLDELQARPGVIFFQLFSTVIKYIFVPVESFLASFVEFYINGQIYQTYIRPFIALACLPLWALALFPSQDASSKKRAFYLLVIMFLLYVVGLTAINPEQGERIRFPVLAGMLPLILWNLDDLSRRLSLGRKASSIRGLGQSTSEQSVSAKQVSHETRN